MHEAATQPMHTKRQPGEMADAHHAPFGPPQAECWQLLLMMAGRVCGWAGDADAHDPCLKTRPWKEHPRDQVPVTEMQDRSMGIFTAIAD